MILPTVKFSANWYWFTYQDTPLMITDHLQTRGFLLSVLVNFSCRAAEEQLMSKPPGYFLIRVSESRIGYTLSYRYVCLHGWVELYFAPDTSSSSSTKSCPVHFFWSHLLPQYYRPLQTFYDRRIRWWPVHHRRGGQVSPLSAGPGGLSSKSSYHTFQRGADCGLWAGEQSCGEKLTQSHNKNSHFMHLKCSF